MTSEQQEQIESLFLRYADGIGSYVLARVGNAELAEEITSRVFLTVVRHYGQQRESVAGWLWAIVRTEIARSYRDRPRGATMPQPSGPLDGDSRASCGAAVPAARDADLPPEQAIRRETQIRLQAALGRLGDDEQRIVYMKFFQDVSNREIAAATGLSANHVGVIVFRTLKKLRELMERDETNCAAGSPAVAASPPVGCPSDRG
ncbi:MAG: sigma-70 family RNA polymerase sigma factor [Planctomycetota bacterium]|nr:sigma-70 family RNA polymerase sigma factor [Planctomycetota bacterium]